MILRKIELIETPDGVRHPSESSAWFYLARKSMVAALEGVGKPSSTSILNDVGRRNALLAAAKYTERWLDAVQKEKK